MMLFCWTFGALVPFERQACRHQGGQRHGAHGRRAQLKRPPRAAARARGRIGVLEYNFKILIGLLALYGTTYSE
jgi:hypothetical protein